jgi:hypothetical protein
VCRRPQGGMQAGAQGGVQAGPEAGLHARLRLPGIDFTNLRFGRKICG